jgi:hypothetical protein
LKIRPDCINRLLKINKNTTEFYCGGYTQLIFLGLSLITKEDLKFRQSPKVYLTKKQKEEQKIASLIERIAVLEKKKVKSNFSGALVGHSEIKNHDK